MVMPLESGWDSSSPSVGSSVYERLIDQKVKKRGDEEFQKLVGDHGQTLGLQTEFNEDENNNLQVIDLEFEDEWEGQGQDPHDQPRQCLRNWIQDNCVFMKWLNGLPTFTLGILTWTIFLGSVILTGYSWVQYGIDLRTPVTFHHHFIHKNGPEQFYVGRPIMTYNDTICISQSVPSSHHDPRAQANSDEKGSEVIVSRSKLASMTVSEWSNPLPTLDTLKDCILIPGYSVGFLFLGVIFPIHFLVVQFCIVSSPKAYRTDQLFAIEQGVRVPAEDRFCFGTWALILFFTFLWKIGLIFCIIWHWLYAPDILSTMMDAEILQGHAHPEDPQNPLRLPSFTWNQTQIHGQCCGMYDYKFWSFEPSLGGYPRSCCNYEQFNCKSLEFITAEEVWEVGCLSKEIESAILSTKKLLFLQFLDILLLVGFIVSSDIYSRRVVHDDRHRLAQPKPNLRT